MPSQQLKRVFVGGLDKDTDPRLLKNGDYHYALNIRNISSESNTEGVIENIKGNKIVSYEFPNLVGKCTPQRTVLFMPSNNYISNYSNWPEAYDYVIQQNPSAYFNGQLIDNPISSYVSDTEQGYYAATFNIGLTSSLSNINTPEIQAPIEYEGSTAENQLLYLTAFVETYGAMFSNAGVTVTVINNNSEYWNDEDWFDNPNLITSNPNYTPGQIYAYALLFEGNCSAVSVNQFYINILTQGSPDVNIVNGPYGDSEQLNTPDNGLVSMGWNIVDQANKNYMEGAATALTNLGQHPDITPVNYSCIGYYEDTKNDQIYYMIASDPGAGLHHILRYDLQTNTIQTIFRDSGNPGTSVFNWRKEFLINDIDKIGDILYWTSRQYGEPNALNVVKSRASMALIDGIVGDYQVNEEGVVTGYSLSDYYPYQLYSPTYPAADKKQYVELIKRPPLDYPTYTYATDPNFKKNNLHGSMWQFKYRYHFYDKEVSAWSPISDIALSQVSMNNIPQENNQSSDNKIEVTVKNSSGIVEFIEIAVLKCKDLGNFSKGNRGDFKSMAKIKNDYGSWLIDQDSTQTVSFYNDKMYTNVDSVESTKLFDNVPRSATTQTILSNNRLAFGNYTEGFDVPLTDTLLTPQYGFTSNPTALTGEEAQSIVLFPYWTNNQQSNTNDLAYTLGSILNITNAPTLTIDPSTNQSDEDTINAWWGSDPLGLGNPLGTDTDSDGFIDTIASDSTANISFSSHSLNTVGQSTQVVIDSSTPTLSESTTDNPLGNGVYTGSNAGDVTGFPRVKLLFNFGLVNWGDGATINIDLNWKFRVRREFNQLGTAKAQDSQEHVCRFNYNIQTLPGETDVATQMSHVAEQLRAALNPVTGSDIPSYNDESDIDGLGTDKPEQASDYDFSWHKRPIVDGTTLILEWVAPKKNVFPGDPPNLSSYEYRMVSSNGSNVPGYSFLINNINANLPGSNNNFKNTAQLTYATTPYNQYGGGINSVSSFKSGAFHNFGLVYYDEKGRCSTVLVDDESKTYVKFPTERTNADVDIDNDLIDEANIDINGPVSILWKINHQAPDWASHYRWFYSRNNTVDEFVQFRALKAYVNQSDAVDDDRIYISMAGLKGRSDSYIPLDAVSEEGVPNPDVNIFDYRFVKGDRVRFITTGSQSAISPTQEQNELISDQYIDVHVSGFKYYSAFDEAVPIQNASELNILASDGSEDGYFLIVREVKDAQGNTIPGYSKQDVINGTDNFRQAILEIYRPKEETGPEETLYYEFGKKYEIDKASGRHRAPIADQGGVFTEDVFGNVTSNTPAVGQFTTGDVYYKSRIMQQETGADIPFSVEDYYLNDYQETNHFSIGRVNIYSVNYKEDNREASITYSDVYQPDTAYNGLNSFNLSLFNWEDYDRVDGGIQKIESRDTDLIMIQEDETYRIPVEKDVIFNAKGDANVALSNKILGKRTFFFGKYGISKNPESFVKNGNIFYWTDIKRGAVLRLSRDGITVISDLKMSDYFRDRSNDYDKYDPQYNWSLSFGSITGAMLMSDNKHFRIKGGYNPKHNEYIIQFPEIMQNQDEWEYYETVFEGSDEEWQDFLLDHTTITEGSVVSFAEKQKRWLTFYSHVADYYGKINRKFVSWKDAGLYIHDEDEENYNTFYGELYQTMLDFYFNKGPSSVKGYKSITLESTQTTNVGLTTDLCSTSINQNNFDEREGKLYAQIPFVTQNGVGGEIIGVGTGSTTTDDNDVLTSTIIGSGTSFTNSNLIIGTSDDPTSNEYGDQLFYFDEETQQNVLVGTISAVVSDTELTLVEPPTTLDEDGNVIDLTFDGFFLFVVRNAFAEGDRVKGRFMETRLSKLSNQPIEIFSVGSTVFNSELSDD